MRHSTATVNELNAAKRLILKHFELVIGSLMHISGLTAWSGGVSRKDKNEKALQIFSEGSK
jgi:hypothetical protein